MVTMAFFSLAIPATAQTPCIKVDLQGVSVDPLPATIGKGQTATVMVAMKNNGPCTIPQGEATAQITLIGDYLDPGTPLNFIDICGQWSYLGVISKDGQHNLFFQNNGGPIPAGGKFCSFQFDVKGNAETPANAPTAITLVSTLSATATTADLDGRNQSAGTELRIMSSSALPLVLADFSATASGCNAILGWKTSAEKKLTDFEIEQSTDGYEFTKIGTLPAKNNAAGSAYEFTYDQGPGSRFYRLKMIEKGGAFSHSKMISIDTKCTPKKGFNP
jgi:hypothetical protein